MNNLLRANLAGALPALVTAVFWGALPIAVQRVLPVMDPLSIVWLRFTTAALWLWCSRMPDAPRLPQMAGRTAAQMVGGTPPFTTTRRLTLLAIAVLCLGGNFVLFSMSLNYLSASASQIVAQLGPMFLLLGGIVVLREPLLPIQAIGVLVLVLGLGLFFNERLGDFFNLQGNFGLGLALGFTATTIWACYGLAQKVLLREMAAPRIMRIIYTCSAVALFPLAKPAAVLQLDIFQLFCLAFCCLNTLVAYGCFARAMARWHAAKVSALITMTPLCTLAFEGGLHLLWPGTFPSDSLNHLAYVGAFVVVVGAGLTAVGPALQLITPFRHH